MAKENYDPRSDSIAWEIAKDNKGNLILDHNGKPMYQSVPVATKEKGIIFCPYCNRYVELKTFDLGYGLKTKGCEECSVTIKDFHVKRVNSIK